ncbi:solute carrier family 40 member 1-like, partial [Convolutriloba macropyga]|uniref:solute carrier family 40 member 1-like n=1 Tax=Convolutriloba macropyga TaxID=536237 RepID=UPI003F5218F8
MDDPYRSTTDTIKTKRSRRERFLGIKSQLYFTHALQAWGDRWWAFSLGLFLVILSPIPGSLRVTACNSISISVSLILLLQVIGYWIDLSKRLHVIRVTVFTQNMCAVASNVLIYLLLDLYLDEEEGKMKDEWPVYLYLCGIILLSVIGRLSSAANSIAIEKDWVVVIANAGHFALTDVNATMRRIDMVTNIVAPIFIGFLMDGPGHKFTAMFIAVWNVVSAVFEYSILVHIYTMEPALSKKSNSSGSNENVEKLQQEPENAEMKSLTSRQVGTGSSNNPFATNMATTSFVVDNQVISRPQESRVGVSRGQRPLSCASSHPGDEFYEDSAALAESMLLERTTRFDVSNVALREREPMERTGKDEKGSSFGQTTCNKLLFFFLAYRDGFRVFNSYTVKYAGLALAMLYLTVLNFSSVTNGYMMLQGFSESYISITMAASSVMGVVGTIIFPILKNRLGLPKTTMCGSVIQITFVSVSVASFFLPGSPWHMLSQNQDKGLSVGSSATTMAPNVGNLSVNASAGSDVGGEGMLNSGLDDNDDFNFTSVIVFAIGIIFSRAGLWTFDLGVTQMIQESVDTSECGRFSAFQKALQSSFDLLCLLLVIAFPRSDTYAWLGFVSFAAVSLGTFK